jgi:hypothetical protein
MGAVLRLLVRFGPKAVQAISRAGVITKAGQLLKSGKAVSKAAQAAKIGKGAKFLSGTKNIFGKIAKSKLGRGAAKIGALAGAGWVGIEQLAGTPIGMGVLGAGALGLGAYGAYKYKKHRDKKKQEAALLQLYKEQQSRRAA